MPKFLDVRRVVDSLVAGRRDRFDALGVLVELEDGLHCHDGVQEGTVSEVFGVVLDHFVTQPGSNGLRVRIGWLPASNGSRVFFLTNASENGSAAGSATPASDGMPNGAVRDASLRVEREGGRLWAEVGADGEQTFFVLFGPQPS